jgi:tetratricopeptide (TPR) repeat protein
LRRYDEVISACDAAIELGKKSALIYELRGLAEAARADYAGAIRDYSRALEIRPHDGRLLVHRGWAYLLFDSPKPALVDFEEAIKVDPADPDARNGRGMAHARLGDHRAAVADAKEALRLGKSQARVSYNAARIYAVAASVAASDLSENGRVARQNSSRYQDAAVQLIREAFEQESPAKRAAFWQDAIQPDPALKAIRRRLNYEELIAANKKPGT